MPLILASIRNLNRIAKVDPSCLVSILPQAWIDPYSQRFNDWHLPCLENQGQELVNQIETDGYELLAQIYHHWINDVPIATARKPNLIDFSTAS